MTEPDDVLHTLVLPRLEGIRKIPSGYQARCPAHEDHHPSLSISVGNTQPVILQCLAGATRVITREGTKTLAELAGGVAELLVPGPVHPVWQKAPISSFGEQPLMRITLGRFNVRKTIYATRKHRWFAQKREGGRSHEVVTESLESGMRLRPITKPRKIRELSSFGVAHGFTYGDGHLIGRGLGAAASFATPKDDALLSYFPHMSVYEAGEAGRPGRVGSREVQACVAVRRVTGLPTFFKELPTIAEAPAYLYGWLAGYFAADGSIEGPAGPAVISSADRHALEFVRDVATRLGIVTYPIQEQWRRGSGVVPSAIYKVTLRAADLPPEFFILPHHRERWVGRKKAAWSQESWRVVSVEETDRIEEVYCATVEGPHAFALEDNILTGNCHAGCTSDAILSVLSLTWEEISAPREDKPRDQDAREKWTPAGPASDIYDYHDEKGALLFQVLRVPQPGGKKTFRQRVPDPLTKSGWKWRLDDTRRVPYRLPQLLQATEAGETIFIVEGEKDVHSLIRAGVTATCNPQGAGKWQPEFSGFLVDAEVRIIADKDKPGQAHARAIAENLDGVAASVTILEPFEGKDVTEHLNAGKTLGDLLVTWATGISAPVDLAPDLHVFLSEPDPPQRWVIPDLIEHGDRLIWTGFEGLGKTTILRLVAVAAAAGIHPFRPETFKPQRVLYIDCENSERQGRKHFRGIERVARMKNHRVPDDTMFLIHRPAGIDLSRDEDAAWLLERVTAHNPDLLVCGPFYRLHSSESEEERGARKVVKALDQARVFADCAVIVEHHAPHGHSTGTRAVRPFGSSLLLRWPEMGMGIVPNGDEWPCRNVKVLPWRGNRDERHWPKALRWSVVDGEWPWVVDTSEQRNTNEQ